jgi:hypothetical protein
VRTAALRSSAITGLVLAINAGVVLAVREQSAADSYGGRYGSEPVGLAGLVVSAHTMFLPFSPSLRMPAADLIVLALGAAAVLLGRPWRRPGAAGAAVLTALSLPAAGWLVYSRWPTYYFYYAMPFTLAAAMLLSWTVGTIEQAAGAKLRGAAIVAMLVVATLASLYSFGESRSYLQTRRIGGALVDSLEAMRARLGADSVLVAGGPVDAPRKMSPAAYVFGLTEVVADRAVPVVVGVPCEQLLDAGRAERQPSTPVVVMMGACDELAKLRAPSRRLVERFPRARQWPPGLRPESLTVELWLPPSRPAGS